MLDLKQHDIPGILKLRYLFFLESINNELEF